MSLNQQLNSLFEQWEGSIEEYKGVFIRDGIINEPEWEKTNPKILFVAKEANQQGNVRAGDFREEWKVPGPKYPFADRITEWAFGIINDFPKFYDIFDAHYQYDIYLQKIAFINIKKMGGLGIANSLVLGQHFRSNVDFLSQQISIINPEIIILCLSFQELYRTSLFKGAYWKPTGYDINVARWNNIKLIDFYHPSARNGPAASYSLMQNVVRSDVFKEL